MYWLITKSAWEGCQTNLHCALSDDVENGCYYSDCSKGVENEAVTKENWDRLWQISEKELGVTFGA